ncbi:hypothetical protein HDV01_002947 [Terramyces sp. JEL0728]|nr:hypothetical protein HDV01_002947 [Terramyces sp. JEL0728]
MDYLKESDLLHLSLINKYYYQKLSIFRLLHDCKVTSAWPTMHFYCNPNTKMYYLYPNTDDENKAKYLETLKSLKHCEFVFHHIYIGTTMFNKLYDCLPPYKHLNLIIETETDYDELGNILESDLVPYMLINLQFEDNETMAILQHIDKMKRLNTLVLDSYHPYGSGYSDETDTDAKIMHQLLPKAHLNELHVMERCVSSVGASLLASVLPCTNLTILNLCGNCIEDRGGIALANALPNTKLKDLNLESNQITAIGASAIAQALPYSDLEYLDLSFNKIGAVGLTDLSKALKHSKILKFNIYSNSFSSDQLYILFDNLPGSKVQRSSFNDFSDLKTTESFISNLPKCSLKRINFKTSNEYLEPFLESVCSSRLEHVWIQGGDIRYGNNEAEIISKYINRFPMQTLDLYNSAMGNDGLKSLFSNLISTNLKTIRISQNELDRFDSRGIEEVFMHLQHTHLTELAIESTKLDDDFLKGIAPGVKASPLQILSLSRNGGFTVNGILQFVESMVKSRLYKLKLDFCVREVDNNVENRERLRRILCGSQLIVHGILNQ